MRDTPSVVLLNALGRRHVLLLDKVARWYFQLTEVYYFPHLSRHPIAANLSLR